MDGKEILILSHDGALSIMEFQNSYQVITYKFFPETMVANNMIAVDKSEVDEVINQLLQ